MKLEMEVKSIEKVTRQSKDETKTFHKLKSEEVTGSDTVVIKSEEAFTGLKAGSKFTLTINNPQKILKG